MKRRGFTLIEIIVSVTLLLLLSGLFMANYNAFNNSQTVKKAASDLIANLQAARTKAASGVKPAGCGAADTLIGYRVSFTGTTYTVRARCLVGATDTGFDAKTFTLPAGVTFTSPTPGVVTFYALDRGASAALTITLTDLQTTVKVSVFTSGIISDFVPTPTP
jgi:prepilin-type N-terminal cleavage/methylation domain-containing protein